MSIRSVTYIPQTTINVFPTGTADDVNIQAAITQLGATGGKILLAPGTFDIQSTIILASNIWIQGSGVGNTILKLHADRTYVSTAANVLRVYAQSADITNFKISDMTIDGNVANQVYGSCLYGYQIGDVVNGGATTITTASNDVLNITLDGTTTHDVTIAASTTGENGSTFTLCELVKAVQAACTSAFGASKIFVAQTAGKLVIASATAQTGTITVNSGTAKAGIFGTGTAVAGSNDGSFNGIIIRGSSAYYAQDFEIYNIETKNCGYHGVAIYDGVKNGTIHQLNTHDNNYRGIHAHSSVNTSGTATDQSTNRLKVYAVNSHKNGQGFLNQGLSGFFVGYDNMFNTEINNISVYDEPSYGIQIAGENGDYSLNDGVILTNSTSSDCGFGIYCSSTRSQSTRYIIANNIIKRAGYNFFQGNVAVTAYTITAGVNDSLVVTLKGTTHTVTLTAGAYGSLAAVVTQIQKDINAAFAADGPQVTLTGQTTSTYISGVPYFSNGLSNNNVILSAVSSGANIGGLANWFGGWYTGSVNVSAGFTTTSSAKSFTVTLNAITKTVTVAVAAYGSIATLVAAMQTACDTAFASGDQLQVSATGNFVSINPIFADPNAASVFKLYPVSGDTFYSSVFGTPTSMLMFGNRNNVLTQNLSTTRVGAGIIVTGTPGGRDLKVKDNIITSCLGHGINFAPASASALYYQCDVSGNTSYQNAQDFSQDYYGGWFQYMNYSTFIGNKFVENGVHSTNYRQAYFYVSSNNSIIGNLFDNVSNSVNVCMRVDDSSTFNTITGNIFNRSASGNANLIQGNNNKVANNLYLTSGVLLDQATATNPSLNTGSDYNYETSRSAANSITSNTTLASDSSLVTQSLAKNAIYDITWDLSLAGSTLSTTGIKVACLLGTGQAMTFNAALTPDVPSATQVNFQTTTSSGTALDFTAVQLAGVTVGRMVCTARVTCGSTNSAVNIQFAQSTSSGTALVIGIGSKVTVTKIG